jgi:hypothetical protein
MEVKQVGLVSEESAISMSELARVSAALQKQVARDVSSHWEFAATVDVFAKLEEVPLGYWPIVVMDNIQTSGAAGVHEDKDGQPFALVQYAEGWSLTASHECLEMLCDPFGNRLKAGNSPKRGQGRVQFLVEICDPSEDATFAYTVNGVTVSDFYTPRYFDPVTAPGVVYSFTGAIKNPRQVLKGGYLSWHDPVSDHWFQQVYFGPKPQFRDLGPLPKRGQSARTVINRLTPEAFKRVAPSAGRLTAARGLENSALKSTNARAKSWRQQIAALRAGGRVTARSRRRTN